VFLLFLIRRGKFTTNPSPYGRIRQVQNTYSCHHFDAINSKLNWIITALGSAVLNKDLKYKCKETWYKFKFANAHWNLHFSPMVCACFYKHTSWLFVCMHTYVCAQMRGFLFCTSMRVSYMYVYHTTGWQRLMGSPKLQIIFQKRAIKYRSLLRKMTYKDKGSYESSPPCTVCCVCSMCVSVLLCSAQVCEYHTCVHTICVLFMCAYFHMYMSSLFVCMHTCTHTCVHKREDSCLAHVCEYFRIDRGSSVEVKHNFYSFEVEEAL